MGALIRDDRNRVYVHRRTAGRSLLPGTWDIVGGHVDAGETPEAALAREIAEETGWTLRRVEAVLGEWDWEMDGVVRHEIDYLVDVEGDLGSPRLEEGKHDAYAWVGPADLELMMAGRADGDRRLLDVVAKATRTRLTERLRLEPIGLEHVDDLWRLHQYPEVAAWYEGTWSRERTHESGVKRATGWESNGVQKWMAYDRATGELVGRGGVSIQDVDGRMRHEVGWVVRPDLWGRGYATEIGRAGIRFAFDDIGVDELVAFTESHNTRSRAVMERLGMRFVREFRRPGLVPGRDGVHDDATFVLYATTADHP
ncbi:MAG TPA: GNAT family N-acetyltransferase [Streptosporangiales bacterium]